MYSSVVGIFLSVTFTVINTIFSPASDYLGFVDKFENSLDALWLNAVRNKQKIENLNDSEIKEAG